MPLPNREASKSGALRFRLAFLLFLVVGISILFLLVVQDFLLTILLAAVLAGMAFPLQDWMTERLGGRRGLAAVAVIFVLLVVVGIPLAGFLTLVATQAVQISQGAEGWLAGQSMRLEQLRVWVERFPLVDGLIPEGDLVVDQLREAVGRTGPFLMGAFAAATRGTASFLLQTFILLYSLFFFFRDGPAILATLQGYMPLHDQEKEEILERFVSVTRATLKGSLLIGVIQGALAGGAFWLAGVPGAAFWGTVMVVLSIIPAIGAGLVWAPAVVYLYMQGETLSATVLLIWCATVVSLVDNFLRPRLIGRDARMSDLLILLSTLGGIILFGVIGFIVGPIVAALFVTVWHIYGEAFRGWLPENDGSPPDTLEAPPQPLGPN